MDPVTLRLKAEPLILQALNEDITYEDVSTASVVDEHALGVVRLIAKQDGVICGLDVFERTFQLLDPYAMLQVAVSEGDDVRSGQVLGVVFAHVRALLSGERVALNFLQRMSGIATYARGMARALEGTGIQLVDTRKTTPNMRLLEKYAVKCGGGTNHRIGLYDMVMLKDNHIDFAGGIEAAIDRTRQYLKEKGKNLRIEIEVRDLDELQRVLDHGGVDRIMLDNFDTATLREAVRRIDHRYETEASGGITEATLRQYAETGVDFISVGALTHHIKSLDISLVKK